MRIKLFNFQGECIREANIGSTALVAPSTIGFKGMFFKLKMHVTTKDGSREEFLKYQQCRGAFLSDIEIIKGVEVEA
ncbi:hypothetical protein [Microcoleus sp. D2_18a_B4]|uniref:hypothetical protein n=1 Tax=Microcoleus sp. D2_18a_B4 TaxID=3055329 RepID=UPI002FD1EF88